jgi:hypothetical protein
MVYSLKVVYLHPILLLVVAVVAVVGSTEVVLVQGDI